MESSFKILQKKNFQPIILNLAKYQASIRIMTFSDMQNVRKDDSCKRHSIHPNQTGTDQQLQQEAFPEELINLD